MIGNSCKFSYYYSSWIIGSHYILWGYIISLSSVNVLGFNILFSMVIFFIYFLFSFFSFISSNFLSYSSNSLPSLFPYRSGTKWRGHEVAPNEVMRERYGWRKWVKWGGERYERHEPRARILHRFNGWFLGVPDGVFRSVCQSFTPISFPSVPVTRSFRLSDRSLRDEMGKEMMWTAWERDGNETEETNLSPFTSRPFVLLSGLNVKGTGRD